MTVLPSRYFLEQISPWPSALSLYNPKKPTKLHTVNFTIIYDLCLAPKYLWAARISNGILNATFTFDISQFSQNASSYVAGKGKDLSAAIDGETKGDVRRLLLGLLLVS